jgi:putative FmdB family regulatory protein
VPIYEFVCEACGHVSEVMQKLSDPPPGACRECGAGRLARLVSRTSFQLKGGGWYADLYSTPKQKKAPAAGDAPSGAASPAAGGAAPTGGAAPAEGAGTKPPPAKPPGTKPTGGSGSAT